MPGGGDPADLQQAAAALDHGDAPTVCKRPGPAGPPDSAVIACARSPEKPDCVSAQAMPVAVPMTNRIAPDSAAVSTSTG